jgi:hypothetical protein
MWICFVTFLLCYIYGILKLPCVPNFCSQHLQLKSDLYRVAVTGQALGLDSESQFLVMVEEEAN